MTTSADPRLATLEELETLLARVGFPNAPDFDDARDVAREAAAAMHHLLRRREDRGLPRFVLLFGPSGGGKSTLFNALVGRAASHVSSVERPATRGAVATGSPEAVKRLRDVTAFPTLEKRTADREAPGTAGAVTLVKFPLPAGSPILIDSPDYDTHFDPNRRVAERLLDWAERVVFVTSLERYADRSAEPFLTRLARLGTETAFVLNKVEGDEIDSVIQDFAAHIAAMGGPNGIEPLAIPRLPVDRIESDRSVAQVREFVMSDNAEVDVARRIRAFDEELTRDVLAPLHAWRDRREEVHREVGRTVRAEPLFEPDAALGALEEYEEDSKFWLRYSHRGVLRGVRKVLRNPRKLFSGRQVPPDPAPDRISALVVEQGWEVFEGLLVVARETMKRTPLGRDFIRDGGLESTELTRDEVAVHLTPLVDRLAEFTREKVERFRKEWAGRQRGFLPGARLWALDKILRLLTLALTFSVLPPLIFELLRFIGHPTFSNEVTAEFKESRALFRRLLQDAVTRQLDRYRSGLDTYGPTASDVERLDVLRHDLVTGART